MHDLKMYSLIFHRHWKTSKDHLGTYDVIKINLNFSPCKIRLLQ